MSQTLELLEYPDWVTEHITPELEVETPTDPGEVELWFDSRQQSDTLPTGNEVYEAHGDRLKRSLSFGHLKWLEENPDEISPGWKKKEGLWVGGWSSVILGSDNYHYVPCLFCGVSRSCVYWLQTDGLWNDNEPSGLFASKS